MGIAIFGNWVLALTSLSAGILILDIWYNAIYKEKKETADFGLFFLSLAFFTWFCAGIFQNQIANFGKVISYLLSTINSLFFLLASTYFEFFTDFFSTSRRKARGYFILLATITLSITTILNYFYRNAPIIKSPDFVFSLLTVVFLSYVIYKTFIKRKLIVLAGFSLFTLCLLLLSQPQVNYFQFDKVINQNSGSIYYVINIFNIYSRIAFIITICLLAYSWALSQYTNAFDNYQKKLSELEELKGQLQIEIKKAHFDERENAWQDVAFKAAHKLGNPIDAVDVLLQSLKKKIKKRELEKTDYLINAIDDTIEEAKSVLGEFKSLTKLKDLNIDRHDIVKLIKQTCKSAIEEGTAVSIFNHFPQLAAVKTEVTNVAKIEKARADSPLFMLIDQEKMKQCFNELVANSGHFFNKSHNSISIEFSEIIIKKTTFVKMIYEDNGKGIKVDHKVQIFSPFYSTFQTGTGLGLSIVEKIIELHGGTIKENGVEGQGARFEILLPFKY